MTPPRLLLTATLILLVFCAWVPASTAQMAEIYRWVDKSGVPNYAAGIDSVPGEYRATATQPFLRSGAPVAPTPRPVRLSDSERNAAVEGIRIVKELQSMTRAGLRYADYVPRVADTSARVEPILSRAGGVAGPLREALSYYQMASSAWQVKITRTSSVRELLQHANSPCRAMQSLLNDSSGNPEAAATVRGVSTLWACAGEKIAEAEAAVISTPR